MYVCVYTCLSIIHFDLDWSNHEGFAKQTSSVTKSSTHWVLLQKGTTQEKLKSFLSIKSMTYEILLFIKQNLKI